LKTLLIANRGEIAVRIARTARARGIRTVGLVGPGDEHSRHGRVLDEVHAVDSYLNADRIIEIALAAGADAVHPGYGFLSERDTFADACEAAGLKFVGPPGSAMRKLGGKIAAKQLATASDVPILNGYFHPEASDDDLRAAVATVGFPLLLKASAGGGGRGMRVARSIEEFESELPIARDEARRSFGDGAMMLERYVADPRHIETQFLADEHGNVVVLFERECSIQRRHQKLIEEAPAARAGFDWPAMREATQRLARAAGYVGAGTAEFLVDPQTGEFFFLEVNARLQVEHPVTESITGLDLVAWQLKIAAGESILLPTELEQGDRTGIHGHAIEARIIAEDPDRNFQPSIGLIRAWREPRHPGVRIDAGFEEGDTVSANYDSMIAKVIAHGETRIAAIERLDAALADFHVLGISTNIGFIRDLLADPEFRDGNLDTGFLGRFSSRRPERTLPSIVHGLLGQRLPSPIHSANTGGSAGSGKPASTGKSGPWDAQDRWRNVEA